jgi:hypothetical protein
MSELTADQHKEIKTAFEFVTGAGTTFGEVANVTVSDMLFEYRDSMFDALSGDAGHLSIGETIAYVQSILAVDTMIGIAGTEQIRA